jgi:tetratricopeptide (TPR) repeat protein
MNRVSRTIEGIVLGCVLGCIPAASAGAQTPALSSDQVRRLNASGFDHFYSLEYDEAIRIFERLRDADPANPYSHHRVALAYFYKQLHSAGVLEGDLFGASNKFFRTRKITVDPVLDRNFHQSNQAAIRLCEERLKRDKADQPALYTCGTAYATRAAYQGLIARALLDSMSNARKASGFHTRLIRLNDKYYDAYMVPGLFDFALGSLPGPLKVVLYLVGMSGEKERGMGLVESVARWGSGARYDAQILLTVMYRREKRFADARESLETLASAFPRNYVFPLEIASIHRAADETEEAIEGYEAVLTRVRQGTPGYQDVPVARVHFELGDLYRKLDDLESARRHLAQVRGSRGNTPDLEKESMLLLEQIDEAIRRRQSVEAAVPTAAR